MNIGLYETFHEFLMPFVLEIGKCIFEFSVIGSAYVITRCNSAEGVKRLKFATLGYATLKFTSLYMEYADKIIDKSITLLKIRLEDITVCK